MEESLDRRKRERGNAGDGSTRSALGSGLVIRPPPSASAVSDHDGAPALIAGGQFGKRVAAWDGSDWTTLGLGINDQVLTLTSWDDGNGPALFAGGEFGASPAGDSYLAKWGCKKKPVREHKL